MRRRAVLVLLLTSLLLGPLVPIAPAAVWQDQNTTTTEPPAPDIIPEPNSGSEPQDAGDRGGALQTVLFLLIIGGVAVIAVAAVHQSRRARAERGF